MGNRCSPSEMDPPAQSVESFLARKFTHLVIGGGTAGLVVATRLSENPKITVGVLEAGPPAFHEKSINVPGRFGETLGTKYDWQFETTTQPGLEGRKLPWPRGKVLGGTSALNFMTWNRGCREDYDAWEELGNEGWGWDGLLPYFKKSEHFHIPGDDHQAQHQSHHELEFHGTDGPLQTVYSSEYGASHQYWHATCNKLGVETNRSHMSGSNVGCWTSLTGVTPDSRERSYSATAYYRPNCQRPNLVLLSEATVQEVVLDKSEGEWVAQGVRFTHGGRAHTVMTEGEVIICAGSVQSPQLLELSGIGNSDVLRAAGIDTKVANPNVGENLQDHMMTCTVYEISPDIQTPEHLRADPALAAAADLTYETSRSGPRTAIPSSIIYLPYSRFVPPSTLTALSASLSASFPALLAADPRKAILARRLHPSTALGHIEFNLDTGNYSPSFASQPGKSYATMLQMLQYPFSTGSVHVPPMKLDSGQPTTAADKPTIDPRYYASPGGADVDFRMMVAAHAFSHRLVQTPPLSSIIVRRVHPPANPNPGSDLKGEEAEQEEDLAPWVRANTVTDWHPVGTCAMGGALGIAGGVVDARLRVYGAKGLRVCDASVFPLQISAHLQATVYAVAEKGASLIGEDWEGRGV